MAKYNALIKTLGTFLYCPLAGENCIKIKIVKSWVHFFSRSLYLIFSPIFLGFLWFFFLINTVLTLDICLQHEDIVHNKLQNVVLFYKTTVIVQHHG
jgi:hypothetical protein